MAHTYLIFRSMFVRLVLQKQRFSTNMDLAMGMGCACHAPEVYCILEPRTTSEKG